MLLTVCGRSVVGTFHPWKWHTAGTFIGVSWVKAVVNIAVFSGVKYRRSGRETADPNCGAGFCDF